MNKIEIEKKHKKVMDIIQNEWEENKPYHNQYKIKNANGGIRSSQISALVMYLLKKEKLE